jgi:hypothetical protein
MASTTTFTSQPCVVCGKVTEVELDTDKFRRWRIEGEKVQDVWPEKSLMERETLISGVCSDKCWDELWGEEEE